MNTTLKGGSFAPLSLLLLGILLVGCKTTPKVDWNSRIGSFTHDQAVAELGPADKQSTLTDNSTVAEWLVERRAGPTFGIGTGFYGSSSGVAVGQTVGGGVSGRYLRLTFGPDGKLSAWRQEWR